MNHSEFKIGNKFKCGVHQWIVTDVGSRVVVAIAFKEGWMDGPPYALAELVFDENDMPDCEAVT